MPWDRERASSVEAPDPVDAYTDLFGGGMVPFDTAYHDSLKAGASIAEAQRAGGEALLRAFVAYGGGARGARGEARR